MTLSTISTIFYMNGETISPASLVVVFVVVIAGILLFAKFYDVNKAK